MHTIENLAKKSADKLYQLSQSDTAYVLGQGSFATVYGIDNCTKAVVIVCEFQDQYKSWCAQNQELAGVPEIYDIGYTSNGERYIYIEKYYDILDDMAFVPNPYTYDVLVYMERTFGLCGELSPLSNPHNDIFDWAYKTMTNAIEFLSFLANQESIVSTIQYAMESINDLYNATVLDIKPANLATDENGDLILLDVLAVL